MLEVTDLDYRSMLKNKKRIVVKVGTTSLTFANGSLNLQRIEKLARVLTNLRNSGKEVVLVTSGAIGVGSERLALCERPRDIKGKQAAAAVGQAVLMQIYQKLFMEYNQIVAQILVTRRLVNDELMKFNAINTFEELLKLGVIPIVNENDTIATEEIEFGDNDTLSAVVASLIGADLLILLSDIEGLYTDDPRINKDAKLIPEVYSIDDNIDSAAKDAKTKLGTGGMTTKIAAAKIAFESNIDVIIGNGENPEIVSRIIEGERVGTLFVAKK